MSRLPRAALALLCAATLPAHSTPSFGDNVVYAFENLSDGAEPGSNLVALGGALYGTADGGLDDCPSGCGVVFSIDPRTGSQTTVHMFLRDIDGAYPGNLIALNGVLYGTTALGMASNASTVFSLDPATGTETTLYSFQGGGDGSVAGGLVAVNGMLYGVTADGGQYASGTVFALNPLTGVKSILYAFKGGADGGAPYSALTDVNGMLYGVTGEGYGSIFSIDPGTGAKTTLYSFQGGGDGAYPYGGLTSVDGKLFGTTEGGGSTACQIGCGTVFLLNIATGVKRTLYAFQGAADGGWPNSALILWGGLLYGTAAIGGASADGVVFGVDRRTGAEKVVHAFKGGLDGAGPDSNLLRSGAWLYGATAFGGGSTTCPLPSPGGCGTVFAVRP